MNIPLFKAAIAAKGYTQKQLAKEINMSESTIVRKAKTDTFTIAEAEKIIAILEIKDPIHIFLR